MDDNKVSHVEHDVIDDVMNKAEEMFPGLTVTKVNIHSFLGIKIRYLKKRRKEININ